MAEQNNEVASELKLLDVKEPDPSSLNVREPRARSVNQEIHMPSIRQPSSGPYMCMVQYNVQRLMVFSSHYL